MCGIAGALNLGRSQEPVPAGLISGMLAAISHRGPDEFGIYTDECAALGSARLSIIDLSGGQQPIANEAGSLWIVFNGEVFNYLELRPKLEACGHRFTTRTDTEVVLHLYEEYGADCLRMLNGQFAVAIWDCRAQRLFLARDRLGVRPLYYIRAQGRLFFASEIKSLLNVTGGAEIDPLALDEIFTFWSTLSPRTTFRGVSELPPGCFLTAEGGETRITRYWSLDFTVEPGDANGDVLGEFRALLSDAVKIRLRADVPVGAYLSGGLDSSVIAAMVERAGSSRLDTFSIAFSDPAYDESAFQSEMAARLGTNHHVVYATHADIGAVFPAVVWHAETPLLRTAPAPMFLLSRMVHEAGFKVVLTGEGADEFLAGYDIFKEAAIRRFWARQPGSPLRPLLLKKLYPEIAGLASTSPDFLAAYFKDGLSDTGLPHYSHALRWRTTSRAKRFFSSDLKRAIGADRNCTGGIYYPAGFPGWGPLQQAQYLEAHLFLPQYLLSSQGDRMAMAHSVEGRFPFLDHRVVEFCNRLPAELKLRGLAEKRLLRRLGRELLPASIWQRRKRPYRAPIHKTFLDAAAPDYVQEMLSPAQVKASGLFHPQAVAQLLEKARRTGALSESDDMALAGILSTQLVHHQFGSGFERAQPLSPSRNVKICSNRMAGAARGSAGTATPGRR